MAEIAPTSTSVEGVPFSETFRYSVENGIYVASGVNTPLVVEGETMEELRTNAKNTLRIWIEFLQQCIDQDKLDFVEESSTDNK